MEDNRYLFIILGMCLVSYLPRVVPALFISKVKLNPWLERFLILIPYTAMTALVFPGIFYSVPGYMNAASVGTVVAIVSSVLKAPLSVTVILSVCAVLAFLAL